VERSPELRDLVVAWFRAASDGDASLVDRHVSRDAGTRLIGSDPNEWWIGYDTITQVFKAQMREMGGVSCLPGDPQAYRIGDVGWVADRPRFRLPDGTELPVRMSIVFVKEDGAWKVAHQHISIGVPNEQIVGQELTVS
jgi:ketosteroid isomerase-like protein